MGCLRTLKNLPFNIRQEKFIRKNSDMANGNDNFVDLFNAEFKTLTDIGNKYRIRHHETNKIDIIDNCYYDYLFNRIYH